MCVERSSIAYMTHAEKEKRARLVAVKNGRRGEIEYRRSEVKPAAKEPCEDVLSGALGKISESLTVLPRTSPAATERATKREDAEMFWRIIVSWTTAKGDVPAPKMSKPKTCRR